MMVLGGGGGAQTLIRATQRATQGCSGTQCPSFRYLIQGNPPMPLRVAYRRVLGLIAWGLFKTPSESAAWRENMETNVNPIEQNVDGQPRVHGLRVRHP